MLSYFNRHDAQMEVEAVLNDHAASAFAACQNGEGLGSRILQLVSLAAVLLLVTLLLRANLLTDDIIISAYILPQTPPNVVRVVVQDLPKPVARPKAITQPAQLTPSPMPPKQRVIQSIHQDYAAPSVQTRPQDSEVRQLASVQGQQLRAAPGKGRPTVASEGLAREMPDIQTPVIAASGSSGRSAASDGIVRAVVVEHTDASQGSYLHGTSIRSAAAEDAVRPYTTEQANLEQNNSVIGTVTGRGGGSGLVLSHSELDSYHYQMANLCLRLCAQSIFLREGVGIPDQEYKADWLKITKGDEHNSLRILHTGRWLELTIKKERLKILSDLSFVEMPSEYASSVSSIQGLIEDVTEKLCELLHQGDCLGNLQKL